MNRPLDDTTTRLITEFDEQVRWIQGFILDPDGERYGRQKDRETLLQESQQRLDRLTVFLRFLGDPQTQYASVHIAGTSGKGSVASMIAAILTQCRLKTGLHVSPYLQICTEKLIIDGSMISLSAFSDLVKQFQAAYESWLTRHNFQDDMRLLYGEVWVALTYLWFAKATVDWAVIETGMGGRFDLTNVLPSRLAVITNVDLDHLGQLGPTIEDIAWHKAGIIKAHSLAITSVTDERILPIIQHEADAKQARLYRINHDFSFRVEQTHQQGTTMSVHAPFGDYEHIYVGLPGSFQPINAALAISAVDVLTHEYLRPLSVEAVKAGLNTITFGGRMEVMQQEPLVMLDGAHNPHKMEALVTSLGSLYPDKKITAIFGVLATKDARSIISRLLPIVSRLIVTNVTVYGKPAIPAVTLAEMIRELSPQRDLHVIENMPDSITWALRQMEPQEMLLITGSLYLVGEARSYWIPKEQLLSTRLA